MTLSSVRCSILRRALLVDLRSGRSDDAVGLRRGATRDRLKRIRDSGRRRGVNGRAVVAGLWCGRPVRHHLRPAVLRRFSRRTAAPRQSDE